MTIQQPCGSTPKAKNGTQQSPMPFSRPHPELKGTKTQLNLTNESKNQLSTI